MATPLLAQVAWLLGTSAPANSSERTTLDTNIYTGTKDNHVSSKGFYTNGAEDLSAASTKVNSIPLTDVDSDSNGSIGQLVSNATQQMSSQIGRTHV